MSTPDGPSKDRPREAGVESEIQLAREHFAGMYQAGQRPRIEAYLDRVPAEVRGRLLEELLVLELSERQSAGEVLDAAAYRRRFPEHVGLVEAALVRCLRRAHGAVPGTMAPTAVLPSEAVAAAQYRGAMPEHEQSEEQASVPERIGRFAIRRLLGRGGFGQVFLAHDPGLDRLVALKVPRSELLATGQQRENFLHEARTAAKLKHPSLVTVYEVQQAGDLVYIVQEYIEGQNLSRWASAQVRSWREMACRLVEITTAIGYVHQEGFYHRDLKPGNILIDTAGHAHVADFGLAVHEDALRLLKGKAAGTPQYMSPEQVRGETHWIDGRTDIWALGVILYELLAGHRPFESPHMVELFAEIQERDPQSPRMKHPSIPKELERICLKCLAKRRTQRYATAGDLLEDLQTFVASCPDSAEVSVSAAASDSRSASGSDSATVRGATTHGESDSTQRPATPTSDSGVGSLRIVPKGLRSFDEEDQDFFLELVPGPRGRDGLPESVHFWKTRIEQRDADSAFPVGVMYGPSGCGKSSLVKAGLLPRLAEHVLPVFVETAPVDTELRLLKQLRKGIPRLAGDASLVEALARLREGSMGEGRKVLLVLDQFEQWLHGAAKLDGSALVRALRQCDGAHVQCLILVRDDFWMSTTRFMQAMEVPQVEHENSALVDLFDPSHARKVLRAFGLAYGRLPEHGLSAEQERFLDRAVQELTHEGKVICVQLSLLADMMKGRPWTTGSLQEVGGASGVGVSFLEETFVSRTAPPTHRLHAKAAQAVLQSLLPEVGTNIKGHMRTTEQLRACSGYAARAEDFQELLRILNTELRLITPTDPEGEEAAIAETSADPASPSSVVCPPSSVLGPPSSGLRYYQLTHDYLVPSLRTWLTRKQKETRRGRAELRLAERAVLWNAQPENRQLPSWWEDLSIRFLTDRRKWNAPQRRMMRRAAGYFGVRTVLALVVLAVLAGAGEAVRGRMGRERAQEAAQTWVNTLLSADVAKVPELVGEMPGHQPRASRLLGEQWSQAVDGSAEKLRLALALVGTQPKGVEYLYEALLAAKVEEFFVIRDALAGRQAEVREQLWEVLAGVEIDPQQRRLRAAGALAVYDPTSARWEEVAGEVTRQLLAVNPAFLSQWQEALRPVGGHLAPELARIVAGPREAQLSGGLAGSSAAAREQLELAGTFAATVLTDYARDDVETLTRAAVDAEPQAFEELFAVLRQRPRAVAELQRVLTERLAPTWSDSQPDPQWQEPGDEVRVAIEVAQGMLAERFAFCQSLPWEDLPGLLEMLKGCGYRPTRVRPYREADRLLVAAVWKRDGAPWRLERELAAEQVPPLVAVKGADGLVPCDVAAYVPAGGAAADAVRYVLLWSPTTVADEQRQVVVGLEHEEFAQRCATLVEEGFASQNALHVTNDAQGRRRYSGIWSNRGAVSTAVAAYGGWERVDQPQWDVSLAEEGPWPDPQEPYRRQVARSDAAATPADESVEARRERALARYHVGQWDEALADLDVLAEQDTSDARVARYRCVALARLGRVEEAREGLSRFLAARAPSAVKTYVQLQVAATLGEMEEVERLGAEAEANVSKNDADLLEWARVVAQASLAVQEQDAGRAAKLRARALALLQQAIEGGFQNADLLRSDVELVPLRRENRFAELLGTITAPYAGLWQANVEFESRLVAGRTREEQLRESRQLSAEGFRPVAWTVAAVGEGRRVEAASVWHRPLIPDERKEELAQRQASAGAALLRLGAADAVWPLLQHQPDPRLRSYLLARLTSHGADPELLWQRLQVEAEDSIRRALILGLGDYAAAGLLGVERRSAISEKLLRLYRDDPDPGIHGAAEWTLKQLGQEAEVAGVRAALATGQVLGDRRWYVTRLGEHTMVVIDAQEPFLMGSPVHEAERDAYQSGQYETRHWRRISRRFAVAAHEVALEEYQIFNHHHRNNRWLGREARVPVNSVNWNEAVRYCNWLSEREGIPKEQWCYDPSQEFADGMQLYPDYLRRTGYRLPTEAEWEYACRAGAITARPYGETAVLLRKHAVYGEAGSLQTLAVGGLQPNDVGVFDMLGNVAEWTQSGWDTYATDRFLAQDGEQFVMVRDGHQRVVRDGWGRQLSPHMRSAYRSYRSKALTVDMPLVSEWPGPTPELARINASRRYRRQAFSPSSGEAMDLATSRGTCFDELLEGAGDQPCADGRCDHQ